MQAHTNLTIIDDKILKLTLRNKNKELIKQNITFNWTVSSWEGDLMKIKLTFNDPV